MLTRSQVARRLGKSVATVRRLEGMELYPRRDWRGVWRFDEAEVGALQRKMDAGFRAPVGLKGRPRGKTSRETLEQRVGALEELIAKILELEAP